MRHFETSSVRDQNVLDTIGHDRQLVSQQRLSAQVLVEGDLLVGQAFEGPFQGHHVQEHVVREQLFLRHFFRACCKVQVVLGNKDVFVCCTFAQNINLEIERCQTIDIKSSTHKYS